MGFLKELRSSLENPATPLSFPAEWLLDIFNGGRTDSGIRVSELTALQVTTVYACVDIISSNIARLPLNVYEITGDDASRLAREQDLHWLLHNEPNEEMTSFVFRKAMQCHALLWSNGYAEIERDGMGRPVALWPLSPHKTKPRRATEGFSWTAYNGELLTVKAGELFYATTEGGSDQFPERPIHRLDMVHILGLSLDGRIGKDVIELSRQAIGLALAAEKFGGKFFANGLRPSGVVTLPQNMKEQAVENFKRSLQESYGGENMQRPMVLEEGMTWTQQTTTPTDAQFIELRKYQREEISSIFHVPPHMVGESGGTNRSTAEQLGMEFLTYTLSPWLEPWKQELHRKLFPQRGRTANKFYPDFDVEDLLYPDADSRGKYYATLKQWGIANTDDIRRKLKWNPVGGKAGTTLWMPVNMMDAEDPMTSSPTGGGEGGGKKEAEGKGDDRESKRYARAYGRLFSAAFQRVIERDNADSESFYRAFGPVLSAIADGMTINVGPLLGADSSVTPSEEVAGFVRQLTDGMFKRRAEWKTREDAERVELDRAIRSIKFAVYRDVATQIAAAEQARNHPADPATGA